MMEVNQKSAKLFNFRYVFLLPCVVPETICAHFMGLIAWIRDNKPVYNTTHNMAINNPGTTQEGGNTQPNWVRLGDFI